MTATKQRPLPRRQPHVAVTDTGSEDANAHLFKSGYDSVLKPLFKSGTFKRVYPKKKGTFDCKPSNHIEVKADFIGN